VDRNHKGNFESFAKSRRRVSARQRRVRMDQIERVVAMSPLNARGQICRQEAAC
jgi:hypothetical protein